MQTQVKKLFLKQAQLPKRGELVGFLVVADVFLLCRFGVFWLNGIMKIVLKQGSIL